MEDSGGKAQPGPPEPEPQVQGQDLEPDEEADLNMEAFEEQDQVRGKV